MGSEIFGPEEAGRLDEVDPLRNYRDLFAITDPNLIYLDGNSLGVLPQKTLNHITNVISLEWGDNLIRSWNTGWYIRPQDVASKIARIIGAQADEVAVTDSTSVNLYKLTHAALQLKQGRRKIVSDELNFPSDLYIFQGVAATLGRSHHLKLTLSNDGITVPFHKLERIIDSDTALVSLSLVAFKSAFMYDMEKVTRLAHSRGALVLWDLSHATGAVPIELNRCNADMAVGCTYKYLNGGPGAPAFLYVRKDLHEKLQSPVWGWFGQDNPFNFDLQYNPASGINRFMAGTPPILSLSALDPALDIILDAGMDAIREKSVLQSEYLIGLYRHYLQPLGYSLGSPADPAQRGSHVSIRHPEAYRICKALIDPAVLGSSVIPDFRQPDNIRIGITPLYTRFTDIFNAVQKLYHVVKDDLFQSYSPEKEIVT